MKIKYYKAKEIQKLIQYLIEDDDQLDLVDHDFELQRCLRKRHINQINKKLQESNCSFKIISCKYSIPHGEQLTYKTPYFVYTENINNY